MTQKKDQVTAHVQLGGMINYIPCSVEVGEVTTLPAGSDATVTNSGNEHQIVLDFGLPKGDKGDQGETGETGKSAYEYAVEQGYEGTEEDFGESLATVDTKATQAASSATAAAASATSASGYSTSASNSATAAAGSAANAADSEQNAATSAASAQSHAVNAANSALLAGQAVTSANASASAAATQAANAANSATLAAQMASAAATSASSAEVGMHNASESAHPYIQGSLDNHIADKNNPHEVTKAQLGLGNVDNTSDANKPISSATQTALNNCVKKNESPTLNAGDEYVFNFVAGTQRAKLELTEWLGFEMNYLSTGAEINLRSYGDVEVQAPSGATLAMRQKGNGASIELRNGIYATSASGREIEIKQQNGSAIKVKNNGAISLEPVTGQAVYVNNNPVITTDDKATTSALGVVKVDGETISANNGVISVTPEEWQKPADWVDIRSGALPNSVYFLVGHSADYATYPTFGLTATTSTGTYDVFVDGIKQATTASGTATTLDWATLQLVSGYSVTTPESLVSHIVRVTPTTSTATLTGIKTTLGANYGILWAHFNVANPIDINSLFNTTGNSDGTKRCYVLQAVTSYNNEIQVANKIEGAFHYCYVLKEIPTLVYAGASTSTKSGYRCFRSCYALRKVRLVNFGVIDANSMFMNASAIREIDTQNSSAMLANYAFQNCQSLKKLPNLTWGERAYLAFTNMYALEPTVLHANSNNLLYIGFTGSSGNKVALKGLTVSNEAPFTGGSPQINVSYTDLDRAALINLFNSMPTVSANQVCNITGTTGAADLTAEDLAIATTKGWTVTR